MLLVRYRGSEGMVAWAFHRVSGIAIWLFVMLHVLDIYLAGGNPNVYNDFLKF
jgi:succinate dehydrogenase / fumarate reductase cytochrome b subunit